MKAATLALFLVLVFTYACRGASYYVANSGSDSNRGTLNEPWRTIGKANMSLTAGDTVYIRAGTYNQTIEPTYSGTTTAYIVYKSFPGEGVNLIENPCVQLINKQCIVIDGFRMEEAGAGRYSVRMNNADYCTIKNNYIYGIAGIEIKYDSDYNKILNNTIVDAHNDNVYIQFGSDYNLIEGNLFDDTHHLLVVVQGKGGTKSQYNMIRNNMFVATVPQIIHRGMAIQFDAVHTLIENNVFRDIPAGLSITSDYAIVRNNIFDNLNTGESGAFGLTVESYWYQGNEIKANYGRIYHNTFYKCGKPDQEDRASIKFSTERNDLALSHHRIKNNIIYDFPRKGIYYKHHSSGDNMFDNSFENNDIFKTTVGNKVIRYYDNPLTLTEAISQYHDIFKSTNIEAHPLFVDASNEDFHLSENSSCIDAGGYLTHTVGSGSGTRLKVEDALYFCDGFGRIKGDFIQLENQTERATIIQVDYDNNILTLDRSLSWSDGQGVSLPYNGSAPDIGAYEYGAINSLNAKVTASPSSGYIPLAVNFTGNATGGTPPYNYSWDFGDNVSSFEQNPAHTYSMVQSYAATLTVTDSKGNNDNVSVVINVFNADTSGYLINNTFEQEDEGWGGAIGNTAYEKDNSTSYTGSYSMHVYATAAGSKLSIGVNPPGWDIDQFPLLSVAYKIPNNVPVGIFFETDNGWICLGGSENYDAGSYPVNDAYRLADDDSWHVITLNLTEKIREIYPSAATVVEFEWYTQNNGKPGDEFWFDEVMVFADNNALPTASISLSDPSPTKAGTIEVTVTTSKNVINVPTPLNFIQNDNSISSIALSGAVPGTIFKGIFSVDETVAEGVGYFSLPTNILVDEKNNKGNEITYGAYVKIDRTAPAKLQSLQGYFIK